MMANWRRYRSLFFGPRGQAVPSSLVLAVVLALVTALTQSAQAQTFTVLHNFTGGADGAFPVAGLTMDKAGNIYGTSAGGVYSGSSCSGRPGCGTVFKLAFKGSGWVFHPLYSFQGDNDGATPQARVIIGPDGSLYGTTRFGGGSGCGGLGCGTIFNLKPPEHACRTALCGWTETVLYRFGGSPDGADPFQGDLTFDVTGNIYGTTISGGAYGGDGTVYELTPSNGSWTENVINSFGNGNDGAIPTAGVIFDKAGNLYGTTSEGGNYTVGAVYELTPSMSGWAENLLYSFQRGNDGYYPYGGLIFDQSGNLYGTTTWGGNNGGGGTVFELTPSGGNWTFAPLYGFSGKSAGGPEGNLVLDVAGNLYGTTYADGAYGYGSVFELTPEANGSWSYVDLYDFTGSSDGKWPYGNVMLDANGNLFGTASEGGAYRCNGQGCGVVWEITP